jgi:hypothetical protein
MTGPYQALAAAPGAIWAQMGTVGIEWTSRFADVAAVQGMVFTDAPVSGSEGPARDGQLTILSSGPDEVQEVLIRMFCVLGRATVWLGPAGNGTRAKLVLNNAATPTMTWRRSTSRPDRRLKPSRQACGASDVVGTFNGMRSGSSKRAGSGLGGLRIVTSSPRLSCGRTPHETAAAPGVTASFNAQITDYAR